MEAAAANYNLRSPSVKRIMQEIRELAEPTDQYYAQPLEQNIYEWHFTVRGPSDTEFEGGLYHGRIILPPEYPMKPPSIILLNPNGRFEVGKKICLSISNYHPEHWQPSWSIRTALLAIISFMPTKGNGAIGALDYTPEERKILAKRSHDFVCPSCGLELKTALKEIGAEDGKAVQTAEDTEAISQIVFKGEAEKQQAQTTVEAERPAEERANISPTSETRPDRSNSTETTPTSQPRTEENPATSIERVGADHISSSSAIAESTAERSTAGTVEASVSEQALPETVARDATPAPIPAASQAPVVAQVAAPPPASVVTRLDYVIIVLFAILFALLARRLATTA
eukprot:Colp12_sorted_trinity150504_noHs@32871